LNEEKINIFLSILMVFLVLIGVKFSTPLRASGKTVYVRSECNSGWKEWACQCCQRYSTKSECEKEGRGFWTAYDPEPDEKATKNAPQSPTCLGMG
jgi:hypothetical protein